MRRIIFIGAMYAFCGTLFAQKGDTVRINLGTVAPEGSVWHQVLQEIAVDWRKSTNGTVRLAIYSGTMGDEGDMVRKVRSGQLHAVALSGAGLTRVEGAAYCLQIPMLYRSNEEFDYVRARITPALEKRIEERGFVVLNWSDVGWVQFFSKRAARTPKAMRELRLFTSAGDPEAERLYKRFGFRVVPLGVTDMLTSLQTGMIDAFHVPPLFALVEQSFALAKNMLAVDFSPLAAATLIRRQDWDRVPSEYRTKLLQIARSAAEGKRGEIRAMGKTAVEEMKQRGLIVHVPTAAEVEEWRVEAEKTWPLIRANLLPFDVFDEAVRLRDEYRSSGRSK